VLLTDARLGGAGPCVVQVDSAFERLTGTAARTVRGLPLAELVGPALDRRALARARAHLRRGEADAGKFVYAPCDGQAIGIAWTVEAFTPAAGAPGYLLWILHAMPPEQVSAAGARRRPERAVLMTAPPDGRIVQANAAFTALTGYDAVEVHNSSPAFLVGPRTRRGGLENVRRARVEGRAATTELLAYRRDGRTFWNAVEVLPVPEAPDAPDASAWWLVLHHDISARRARQRRQRAAYHDELTGLPNRALAQARIEAALRRAARGGQRVGLLYVDADCWPAQASDNARLAELAQWLQGVIRAGDTLAYIGGDEFLVIAEAVTSAADTERIAARLWQAAVPQGAGAERAGAEGLAIGVSLYPDDGAEPEQLLQRVDAAIIQARSAGVSWARHDPAQTATSVDPLLEETALTAAIASDEFGAAVQPLVEAGTGRVLAWAVYARCHRAGQGWIPPAHFLPRARAWGVAERITAQVQRLAFDAVALWRSVVQPPPGVVVNLASGEWAELEALMARLTEAGLPLEAGELDVRPETLADAEADAGAAASVQALVAWAGARGMTVAAKAVETAAQAQRMARLGCHAAQGHHFGRPEVV
jgi:diguanylate cyclase (GGDEF)-like protein/PAS domain S-box-containing protein